MNLIVSLERYSRVFCNIKLRILKPEFRMTSTYRTIILKKYRIYDEDVKFLLKIRKRVRIASTN